MTQHRRKHQAHWEEEVARAVLKDVGSPAPPISALQLVTKLGLRLAHRPIDHARLVGVMIEVPMRAAPLMLQELVSHELGHWAIRREGAPDSENAAWYVGAALMMPKEPFLRDLDAHGLDMLALRMKYPYCSSTLIQRRILALRNCMALPDAFGDETPSTGIRSMHEVLGPDGPALATGPIKVLYSDWGRPLRAANRK